MGIDSMSTYLRQFGFGDRTGVDVVGEASGLLPSREWKKRVHRQPWFPGETVITGIGQGYLLTTPLQLASYMGTLANGGVRMQPQVVAMMEDPATGRQSPLAPKALKPVPIVKPENWKAVIEAMADVVASPRGTAHGISRDVKYAIAGKTGTAQVFGVKQDERYNADLIAKSLRDHALFVSFAPVEEPRIAVALIVENGGHGSSAAAPIARRVMDAYLLDEPLPPELIQTGNVVNNRTATAPAPAPAAPAAKPARPAAPAPNRIPAQPAPTPTAVKPTTPAAPEPLPVQRTVPAAPAPQETLQ
jgi:penicillin-binding protein 2